MGKTTPVHVRIDSENLEKLEAIGENATPKKLSRSEMLNVAVDAYVNPKPADSKKPKPPKDKK